MDAEYDNKYLICKLFGSHLWRRLIEQGANILSPDFLTTCPAIRSEFQRLRKLKSLHNALVSYLKEKAPDLIIVGDDVRGAGKWIVAVAREAGIKTLAVQEGCRWFYKIHQAFLLELKRFFFDLFARIYYAPMSGIKVDDFTHADFAAVWGNATKEQAIARGARADRISVVGYPREMKMRIAPFRPANPRLLFLDQPERSYANGSADFKAFDRFRLSLIQVVKEHNLKMLYKLHPLTPDSQEKIIRDMARIAKTVEIVKDGVAEDIIEKADICVAFPTTAILNVLAASIPLVQVLLRCKGIDNLYWDPVRDFGAGLTIAEAKELPDAIKKMSAAPWFEDYQVRSKMAAESMLGPMDGKYSVRFASLIQKLMLDRDVKGVPEFY
jgi:hypothetical protein